MSIALEAMMGVLMLVTLYVVPQLHAWIRENLRHNPGAGRVVHLIVALLVVIPALWVLVAEFDRRTEGRSPEVVTGISIGLSLAWLAASLLIPVWLLATKVWDLRTKEVFRLLVGCFMFSYVVLFIWWVADAVEGRQRFSGHAAWAMPVATVLLFALEYMLLRLGLRLFPPDEPPPTGQA